MRIHRQKLLAAATTAAVAGAMLVGVSSSPAQAAPACSGSTFTSDCDYTVPAGVASLAVTVTGAAGGSWTRNVLHPGRGGKGAVVTARLTVTPGKIIRILVGGEGGSVSTGASGGTAGANGGGAGGDGVPVDPTQGGGGAGGGGFSALFDGTTPIVVAGGGGGGAFSSDDDSLIASGGDAGLPNGDGANGGCCDPGDGFYGSFGYGATANPGAVGAGGAAPLAGTATPGADGTSMQGGGTGQGGAGGTSDPADNSGGGGGGGGGYYGGGAGAGDNQAQGGSGGGGSSYVNPSFGTGSFATATDRAGGSVSIATGPSVTEISPSSGTPAGGTPVTITGSGFSVSPPPTTTATIGGQPCTSLQVVSSTKLTCVTSAHAAGAADVVVTNTESDSATMNGLLTNGFTFATPAKSQKPLNNCVTAPARNGISLHGTKRLLKAHCRTDAGVPIKVRVKGKAARGDLRLFRVIRTPNRAAFIRTYGKHVQLTITWSARATDGYSAYTKVKHYRV